MILYKCHLFGVSPPALASSVGAPSGAGLQQHSSAAWRAHELLGLVAGGEQLAHFRRPGPSRPASSDCSLCLNVERKYQCAWCGGQCQFGDQCQELAASTCPPPRIDSVSSTLARPRGICLPGRSNISH